MGSPAVLNKLSLSAYARAHLTEAPARAPEAIRAELFGRSRFEQHGRSLALAQEVQDESALPDKPPPFFPRVDENIVALRQAYDYVAASTAAGSYVTPAAEWLLDNFHLVEAQLEQIREGVPRRYYSDLPKLSVRQLYGLPRVYGIAWAYVAHTDSVLQPDLFSAFVGAYQQVTELRLAELWALPTTLRVVLLENLRRVADGIAHGKVARELAHAVWDRAAELNKQELDGIFGLIQERGLQRGYLTQLWQRAPAPPAANVPALFAWVQQHCPDGAALVAESQSSQVASNLTVSNVITTFRLVGQVDWSQLIEPLSGPLRVLAALPSFGLESELTRQQLMHAIERLSRLSGRTEREVAERVLAAAQDSESDTPASRTAGFHLLGPGRGALELELGMLVGAQRARAWFDARLAGYLGALAVGTAAVIAAASHAASWHLPVTLAGIAMLLLPASEAAASLIQRVLSESLKVQHLPRLELQDGIPGEHRTLLVMPCMLGSEDGVRALTGRLALHWLANRERNVQFALLTDWRDAPTEHLPGDAALLDAALAAIEALNLSHPAPAGDPPRFVLLHRPRVWSDTQRAWIGWERKRGKLEMLLRLLHAGDRSGFLAPADGRTLASGVRYVVTLDADTDMAPGALRELVAVAAHPLNTPVLDTARRRVVAGHGVLQPRVVTPLPAAHERTVYHALFSGRCGLDPYATGATDIYQDVFGRGSFVGKGLLNVEAMHAVLDRRLPDGAVLSHDLIEGTIARCGYVSDVWLLEDQPHHPAVAASRVHRWTRGDWQLLPLMLRASRNGIDGLGLWKMFDNLRRSLVGPSAVALLTWTAFSGGLRLGSALTVVLAALVAGPLMGAVAGLVPTRRGIVWRHFFARGFAETGTALLGMAWQFSQLAVSAARSADAALRALWRMLVSRRNLLEWTTAEQAQASASARLTDFVRQDALVSVGCLALAVLVATHGTHPVAGAVVFVLWALAPVASWWTARPPAGALPVDEGDARYLQQLARDTWAFFERCVVASENHLPPDNLQMVPEPTVAHRTSPTNIGLYLLSVCCAREFGWIGTQEMATRLDATLTTLERLARHQGHFLNWYDTQSLAVLQPAYVSTVDSGNLACLLLAVAQACRAQDGCAPLADRAEALCHAMDFRPLYSARRHLFHIGLRPESNELDAGYYDLMASEARLTSFLCVAQGSVPRRHWQALGRPFLAVNGRPGLKSWSGSMFEYLMPSLLMPSPPGGLFAATAASAVAEQKAYGHALGTPWGISESAYFAQDHSLAYQYGPFGVPRLALRRTPATDRVIAPYATLMAAMISPHDAVDNLRALESLGARGTYGMYEAVDFSSARQAEGQAHSLVETFMAHHHGMAIAALCNLLCGEAPRRWFASAPLVRAHESLLHEATPRQIVGAPDPRQPPEASPGAGAITQARDVDLSAPGPGPTQLLSNGRYSVALRANGSGISRWRGHAISRWRDDVLRDRYGHFFYLQREGHEHDVSLTAMPAPGAGWTYGARFMADRVQYDARSDGVTAGITVAVSPEDDTELRTVTLLNTGRDALDCALVSTFEAVLTQQRGDEAHPAFSGLFIKARWLVQSRALTLERTPRLAGDASVSVAHMLAGSDADIKGIDWIVDRRALIGRNRDMAAPALAFEFSNDAGDAEPPTGLDPVAGLRVRLRLAPGATARLTFATLASSDAESLGARIDQYLQPTQRRRAMRMAATLAQVRFRDLGLPPEDTRALQDLTTRLMYGLPRTTRDANDIDQRHLWRLGISGDKPIVLVRIHSPEGLPLLGALMRARPWWTFGGQPVDIVVLNGEPNSYLMPLQRDILALRDRLMQQVQQSFGQQDDSAFFLLREQDVSGHETSTLSALARVVFMADGRALAMQVDALAKEEIAATPAASPATAVNAAPTMRDTSAWRGTPPEGGIDAQSGEYRFVVRAGQPTPRPWINVIANPDFGFQISESGGGYTWATNSRMHQLTHWSNDAVGDIAAEHWWLQDRTRGDFMALMPGPLARVGAEHRVRHGQGYTVFETAHDLLHAETTLFVAANEPVKVVRIVLRNERDTACELRVCGLVEWQIGDGLAMRRTVQVSRGARDVLFAQQREHRGGFGGSTAFLAMAGPQPDGWTCDRAEFFDAAGRLQLPQQLMRRAGAVDPAAALASSFELASGASIEVAFLLGHGANRPEAEALAARWIDADLQGELEGARERWSRLLGRVQVKTPDASFDALVNRWLLYQTVSCRLWAKAGFYQAGGAYGYRDQLQDAMALAIAEPDRLRDQILINASRQFPQGDVQHWWHAPGGAGVRTHFSDDLLWLPYALCHYLDHTGESALLDETVEFIEGPQIPDGAEDAYYAPSPSGQFASVYEHAARALERSLATGVHGLPLMGTGDWNDGMNRVGHEGRGESVWLAWFLCVVVERFAPIAEARGDARVARWLEARRGWIEALHTHGWDGAWFRRAFFDNGDPLGSHVNEECRIDLIAQAWSVISGASTSRFTQPAMQSMKTQLVDREAGLLRLLHPPLAHSINNPGYIQAYPPGVRENGGQYSHGAVWALMAQALTGDTEGAWESFEALSPLHRHAHPARGAAYELEPYVMPGDIYSAPPYVGRGGWSWYTGSAAWLYRASVETLLGLKVTPHGLSLSPRVPFHWTTFEMRIHWAGRDIRLQWQRNATTPATGTVQAGWGKWLSLEDLGDCTAVQVTGTSPD